MRTTENGSEPIIIGGQKQNSEHLHRRWRSQGAVLPLAIVQTKATRGRSGHQGDALHICACSIAAEGEGHSNSGPKPAFHPYAAPCGVFCNSASPQS